MTVACINRQDTLANNPSADHFPHSMEGVQNRINPHLNHLSQVTPPLPIDNATDDLHEEILNTIDEIRTLKQMPKLDRKSVLLKLHDLIKRIAEISESHIFRRKEQNHQKKGQTLEEVENVATWTRRQGYVSFSSGVAYPLVLALGTLIGEPIASSLRGLSALLPAGTRGLENWFESIKQPDQFDQSLYIQTAASEKQAIEGLKNLPREMAQQLLQILRQELEAIRATGQRA